MGTDKVKFFEHLFELYNNVVRVKMELEFKGVHYPQFSSINLDLFENNPEDSMYIYEENENGLLVIIKSDPYRNI